MKPENRNKLLTLSLLGLLLVALVLIFYKAGSDEVNKDIFKVASLSNVDKVVLSSPEGQVELQFNGSKWNVNQSYPADDQLITVLFATLQQAEPKRRVSSNLIDSLSSALHTNGVKVSLYEGETSIKNFYAGGNTAKTEAYFLDEEQGPYIITIPGYRVYVAGVFELEENGWRDKRVFNFNWRNFKKLKTQFQEQPDQNFEIAEMEGSFNLVGPAKADTSRLNDYLDAVSLLMVKEYASSGKKSAGDSLFKSPAWVTIQVFDLGDNVYQLDLFRPTEGDIDVWGKIGDSDAVLFGREQVMPILRTKKDLTRQRP